MRRHRQTQRPEGFEVDLSHPLFQGAVFLGLGRSPGSTHFHDSSGRDNHGTLTGMDPATDWVWAADLGRRALDFDGSNDYVYTDQIFNIIAGDWTFSAWIHASSSMAQYDCAFGNCDAGGTGYRLWTRDAANYKWYWETNGSANNVVSLAAIDTTAPHHVCCRVQDAGNVIDLYVDAVLQNTKASANVTIGVGATFLIANHTSSSRYFPMQCSDMCVHNRLLAPSEIAALADPSNVMLGGAIVGPRRRWIVVGAGGAPPPSGIPAHSDYYFRMRGQ